MIDVTNFKRDDVLPSIPEACRPLCETPTFRAELSLTMPVFDVEGPLAEQRRQAAPMSRSAGGSSGAADPAGTRATDKALGKRPIAEVGGSSKETTSSPATRGSGRQLLRGDGTTVRTRTSPPRKRAKTAVKKKTAREKPLGMSVSRIAPR